MPAANSIDELLERMVEANASDLHVTTGTPPAVRVRGDVERLEGFDALTGEETQQLLYRILSSEQQKHLELNRQLDFSYSIPGLARFRVNTYFQRESIGAAFRLIPTELKTLEELGIPESLHVLAEKPRGLVLVTGPTGSGKSTTLAAIIDEINRNRSEHILTIEDPIEFLHRHKRCIVNQREIGPDATSFADALVIFIVLLAGHLRLARRRSSASCSGSTSSPHCRSRSTGTRSRAACSGSTSGSWPGTYVLFTLGLQLNVGYTGIVNFGQAGFMAIGAYAMGVLVVKAHWSFWLALPTAVFIAIGFGLLVGLPSLRLRADYFAIATIAAAEIVRITALNPRDVTGGNQGLFGFDESVLRHSWSTSDTITSWLQDLGWSDPGGARFRCSSSYG